MTTRAPFSWAHLGLVALGGAIGTGLRATILLPATTAPAAAALLVAAINVVGAFALGALTGAIARHATTHSARAVRVFLGAGVLGGFTTYSALAYDTVLMPSPGLAAVLLVGTVAAGTAAAWIGLRLTRQKRSG